MTEVTDLAAWRAKQSGAKTKADKPSDDLVDDLARVLREKLQIILDIGLDDPLFWRRAARAAAKKNGRHIRTHVVDGRFFAYVDELTEEEMEEGRRQMRDALDRLSKAVTPRHLTPL